jgi:hypothetical protein
MKAGSIPKAEKCMVLFLSLIITVTPTDVSLAAALSPVYDSETKGRGFRFGSSEG